MKKSFSRWLLVLPFLLLADGVAAMGSPSPRQSAEAPEVISLFGKPLYPMELASEQRSELEADLAEARSAYDRDPHDADAVIWLGRRLAYLWRYREAVAVYTQGIELHPSNPELYRHRGHRYITLRQFDSAVRDLQTAAELVRDLPDRIEPDGAPNPAGQPRSTLKSNICYHLGLAHYLNGAFESALEVYQGCKEISAVNDDMLVATADWLYMTYRRLGREAEARGVLDLIREDMDILENDAYHKRLLMYKGLVRPDSLLDPSHLTELNLVTQGYGVANWYHANGEKERAKLLLEKILQSKYWAAFGYIAAEADLHRWKE